MDTAEATVAQEKPNLFSFETKKAGLRFMIYVNKEKRVVVAKYAGRCSDHAYGFMFHEHKDRVGRAKCSPNDTFDVGIGMKIAIKRLFAEMFAEESKSFRKTVTVMDNQFRQMEKVCEVNLNAAPVQPAPVVEPPK